MLFLIRLLFLFKKINDSVLGRVFKPIDSRPVGRSPREFEPRRMHFATTIEKYFLYTMFPNLYSVNIYLL